MRIRSIPGALALLPLAIFILPRGAAGQCEHGADRTAMSALTGVERVHVIAGSGSLEVTGRAGATGMAARGRACTSDSEYLDDLRLDVRREGSTLVVEAMYPDDNVHFGSYYARIDLEVDVPQGTPVVIDDGSGDLRFSGTGATRVTDGSGSLSGRDIRGSLEIEDGSGDIELVGVSGAIDIEDGSGEVDIQQVRGAVQVDDGSGDIDVDGAQSVLVSDGSGEIRVANVSGNVTVDDDGSGSIRVQGVGGNFTVDDDGSGDVRYTNVTGRVSIPDDD